jgi:hypothetical protein
VALTQADLDALDLAIASAELEVEYEGRRVRFKDTLSLIAARDHVAKVLAGSAPGGNTSNGRATNVFQFDFQTQRGF